MFQLERTTLFLVTVVKASAGSLSVCSSVDAGTRSRRAEIRRKPVQKGFGGTCASAWRYFTLIFNLSSQVKSSKLLTAKRSAEVS